ncbi:MAG: M48 family metallopeptidase [Bdellovibrionales bacterium]|nr:M48 family metallopeptidase [Bdellovibrionales bacterium]
MIRKAFVRNIRLRVLPSLVVEVRASKGMSQNQILQFLQSNEEWIDSAYTKMQKYRATLPKYSFVEGQAFLYLGQDFALSFADVKSIELQNQKILCPKNIQDNAEKIRMAIRDFYKQEAEDILFLRAFKIAKQMGIEPNRIRLKDLRSRWGSCSHDKKISLSWKLMGAPLSVIDYVIIHEYCHLVHMNHSIHFWKMVEDHCPNWKVQKKWLLKNAMKLDFLEKKSALNF